MAVTNLTGTKWLLEQGWTATSGFGQFYLDGVIYDTNGSLQDDSISHFYIGYGLEHWEPIPQSNYIIINLYPTVLTSAYYYEFEITGGTDVTNTTLINWLEINATQIIEPMTTADKLQDLIDIKQDIKEAIENKGVDLTGVALGGYAEKIDVLPAVVELTQAQYDALAPSETWLINEILNHESFQASNISFTSNGRSFNSLGRAYLPEMNPPAGVMKYGRTNVYFDDEGWTDEAYRTITFETIPTGDLLTWLEANAVKQVSDYDENTYYLIVEEE